ncbi:murein biosynthesis integral membrane protein MurJ [Candidatus Woesebacteria bacterium CG_4_10_14_0_2_um_filter_39_14]|uniref:Probable lipid II flippase MurJ n=5 Tax=Candidatus Woeseibacteriota TaxID=1752722 RepID=A0A2M7X8Z1_9BACT|nr:MAG: murein biosynthesis integral membrane protein MurJ [Candidatus Woesebacteria bacterium CG06_land_8_20_14_3_00_39_27]PIZ47865.1 MAG: murein biosynthesis integral membrane protein MurJ [Candidatus Woesebacteria bacterium CG_4_10_14_0_2_um_filter_39_14]PJA42632.1 MAG: murein biosynthesis integral membrane protein MurJ [Candidatus Woesebacteria bacterium CG_4_9_14_3_um_filter_39_10]
MKSIKQFLNSQQTSVLSAATLIMIMIIASRLLGLVRQRVLANFFGPGDLSLFFAAFRLPDLIFEVLVYGTFASAFIPVFTKALKDKEKDVWEIASSITNIGVLVFSVLALIVIFFANHLYGILTPGFIPEHRDQVVVLSKVLFAAQGFFVISYVLTAVLESSRRFLMPAVAPLFYNLGIILGTIFFSPKLGLMGPVIGVVIGAFSHAAVQLPLAIKLGFRFSFKIRISQDVKKIGRLSLPRVIEVTFLQVAKSVELLLASLISTAAYTYFTFGNSLQLLPVGLFGTSLAKAALPTLSRLSDNNEEFRKTLFNALYQVSFVVLPAASILIVLRIPLVRLVFGTNLFNWESTVQTGLVVSAFGVGVIFQVVNSILARAFYALHNTKTPVIISVSCITLNIILDFILIKTFKLPVWGLAAAFSLASFIQSMVLFILMIKKIYPNFSFRVISPFIKSVLASLGSGMVMFFILKFFDRSVWVKRLSFLGKIDLDRTIPFEKFVLNTQYGFNLLMLTLMTIAVGVIAYILFSLLLKSGELKFFAGYIKRIFVSKKISPLPTDPLDNI